MSSSLSPSSNESAKAAARHDPSIREDREGWIFLHVEGPPYARGWQHGRRLAREIRAAITAIDELLWMDTATRFDWWAANARAMWHDMLASDNGGKLTDKCGQPAARRTPRHRRRCECRAQGIGALDFDRRPPGVEWLSRADLPMVPGGATRAQAGRADAA